ncbi:MAG: hypothetical protein ACFIN4_00850 [Candidatus Walczuchella monophlebidarum]
MDKKNQGSMALDMGLVNKVGRKIIHSPMALRMIKRCINAELDGDATLMYYLTEESQEGKKNVRTENELSFLGLKTGMARMFSIKNIRHIGY